MDNLSILTNLLNEYYTVVLPTQHTTWIHSRFWLEFV